ncbi:hypothetical protein [Janthinobacterium sp. B9-8]|uniref:hypothetical protein n=1 Tax=Janthinobacterium sp. B9-8 TaxID=1236179 RepID=UPI00061D1543|nr:hypothetical protein [Janthinobacterium sp. B9-8]AMC33120.1 hypothetical protein VN23_00025 [Janthinobacterium sp. B9-8]
MNQLPFTDARGAKDWLILLPLINTRVAHAELSNAIKALAVGHIAPVEALKALELLRGSVHDVQFALLPEFAAKPLPLSAAEQTQWQAASDLWEAMAEAYARYWKEAEPEDSPIHEYLPLLAERTLRCMGFVARCYYVVGRKVSDALWVKIFAYYQHAEQLAISDKKVKDRFLFIGDSTTLHAVFIHILLLSAANPNQYTLRRLLWLDQILELFATRSQIALHAPALPGKTPLQIDLATPGSPQRFGQPKEGPDIREIDTLALAQVLSKRIKLLRQGELPEKLGLGNELGLQVTIDILSDLYRLWCEHGTERASRELKARTVPLILGLSAQHRYVVDGDYTAPPEEAVRVGSRDLINIHLFGDLTPSKQGNEPRALPPIELWDVVNETAQGLRLTRLASAGERISLNQLIVVKSSARYLAGVVRWLEESDGDLHMGLVLLPGLPKAAAIRPCEPARAHADYTEIVWLPAMPILKAPKTMLLPNGWFRAGRQCEFWNGESLIKVKFISLVEYGSNFERVHFSEVKI